MPATDSDANDSTAPIVTIAEGRATIRLNRPRQHNRIEPEDLTVLRETFARIDDDPSIRVFVLTGSGGKSFSSGYHIGALIDRSAGHPHGEEPSSDASATSTRRCRWRSWARGSMRWPRSSPATRPWRSPG